MCVFWDCSESLHFYSISIPSSYQSKKLSYLYSQRNYLIYSILSTPSSYQYQIEGTEDLSAADREERLMKSSPKVWRTLLLPRNMGLHWVTEGHPPLPPSLYDDIILHMIPFFISALSGLFFSLVFRWWPYRRYLRQHQQERRWPFLASLPAY